MNMTENTVRRYIGVEKAPGRPTDEEIRILELLQ